MFTYTFEYALQHGINVYSNFSNKYLSVALRGQAGISVNIFEY